MFRVSNIVVVKVDVDIALRIVQSPQNHNTIRLGRVVQQRGECTKTWSSASLRDVAV